MKRLMVVAVFLLAASVVFAGGEGKSCKRGDSETVKLTGTVACAEGSGADCARVFRVANDDTQYTICDKSKVDLASLDGAQVRISGKIVSCDEGKELFIDSASKI
jgi:hypothetical protein